MKTSSSLLCWLVIVQMLIGSGEASAQVADPTEALIGTWDGKAQGAFFGRDEMTIVIRSVKPKEEGAWIAQGICTCSGRVTIDVSLQNGEIVLDFVAGRRQDPVRLVLKGNNTLEGRFERIIGSHMGGTRIMSTPFKFEKTSSQTRRLLQPKTE